MRTIRMASGPHLGVEDQKRLLRVTTAYIAAANALDAAGIAAMLAEDATYESQWALVPIRGRQAVGEYISRKYETMRQSRAARPLLTLGRIDLPQGANYPVALVTQFDRSEAFVALSVDASGWIVRHDILGLVPPASQVQAGGWE